MFKYSVVNEPEDTEQDEGSFFKSFLNQPSSASFCGKTFSDRSLPSRAKQIEEFQNLGKWKHNDSVHMHDDLCNLSEPVSKSSDWQEPLMSWIL